MVPFSTLWLHPTPSQCRYRPPEPRDRRLLPLPEDLYPELTHFYAEISKGRLSRYRIDEHPCRVQAVETLDGVHYVLRSMVRDIPPLKSLGVPSSVLRYLMSENLKGLVLISGPQGAGKTTLAGALVRERISTYGGAAQVIEDPPELDLGGVYDMGIIQQLDARNVDTGIRGFDNAAWLANNALRSGTDIIFFGEVRFPKEAEIVISKVAVNALVITTIHANGVDTAVERLVSLSESWGGREAAASMVASALSIVLYLELGTVQVQGGKPTKILRVKPLILTPDSEHGIRASIRSGRFADLVSASKLQMTQITNGRAL